jgi:regulator of ribosome biosynthesis
MLLPITYDVGNLAVFDPNDPASLKDEDTLKEHCREILSGLIEKLRALPPVNVLESRSVRQLPPPSTPLPRALPVPTAKPMTKWEQFARRRGIHKHKRGAMKFDERNGEWMARHGKHSAKNVHAREDGWIKEWKEGDGNDFSD